MTKVIISLSDINRPMFFDCDNHAGDHDVCIMCSTLCNLVMLQTDNPKYKVQAYEEGHVQITADRCDSGMYVILQAVKKTFENLAEEYPEYVKLY